MYMYTCERVPVARTCIVIIHCTSMYNSQLLCNVLFVCAHLRMYGEKIVRVTVSPFDEALDLKKKKLCVSLGSCLFVFGVHHQFSGTFGRTSRGAS